MPKQAEAEFKWHLPFRTDDGRGARLLGICRSEKYPYVVAIDEANEEDVELYTENGKFCVDSENHPYDLKNVNAIESVDLNEKQKKALREALGL